MKRSAASRPIKIGAAVVLASASLGLSSRALSEVSAASADFMPQGYCYLWNPAIVWLHVISDALITLSYFCIPLALVYLIWRRRDLPFNWIFWMFGLFILGCGTTHLMEIWTVWHASYVTSGVVKAFTAAVSVLTAVMLVPLLPKAIALPSMEHLHAINDELRLQVVEREAAERKLQETLTARDQMLAELADHKSAVEELQVAQAALRENQDRLNAIIQSAMDAILTVNEERQIILFNAAAEQMFGCSAAEAVGGPIEQFIPERFRDGHTSHIRRFGETGITSRALGTLGAIWGRRTNGEEFQLEASISQVASGGRKLFTVILRDITERKRAEEVREHLAAVVDSSDDAIISKTLDGTITSWNRGAAKMFGYAASEVLGKPMMMLFPPERMTEELDILARIRRGESVEHFETVRLRKDGRKIDVSVTISPVRDNSGAIVGASKIARDITERKLAEEALRRSDATRGFALATAKLGEWELDLTTLQTTRSLLHDQIFGYQSLLPEWTRSTFISHVHPDDRKRVSEHFRGCMDGGKAWDVECRIVWANGDIRWVWACGDHYREPSRGTPRMYGIIQDITERKQAEQQLVEQAEELSRQSQELTRSQQALEAQQIMLQSVLDSMAEGLVAADEQGRFILWNPAAARIIGMGAENVPPDQWNKHYGVYMPDTVTPYPPDQNPLLRAIRGEAATAEIYVRNPELDHGVWLEVSGGPLKDRSGALRGGVVAFRDATKRRADERKIRELNEFLEEKVVQRTAQLEVANRELEAFTYSVSHDLRAPLRHIGGFSRILLEDFGPAMEPEAKVHLQRIEDGVRRMGLLVDELLNLARVGRHALKLQTTGMNSIVEEVVSLLQPEIGSRGVTWKVGTLPSLQCDPILVKQVFQNLLANALKFTRPREQAVIEVTCRREGGEQVILVRDNGVGFSMKYKDKLFGVFQRLHRAEDFEGTGIGLATVQRIVHKHGGRIWAESELDQGATFYFTLAAAELVPARGPQVKSEARTSEDRDKRTAAGIAL